MIKKIILNERDVYYNIWDNRVIIERKRLEKWEKIIVLFCVLNITLL